MRITYSILSLFLYRALMQVGRKCAITGSSMDAENRSEINESEKGRENIACALTPKFFYVYRY